MAFEKRVCVLRQIKKGFTADGSALSGAVYVERLGSELTVTPRLLGIAPVKEGHYALALWIEGSVFVVELKDSSAVKLETPSVKSGLAVLLVYVRGEAEPVAFGSCGLAPTNYDQLLATFSKIEKKKRAPAPMSEEQPSKTDTPLPFRRDKEPFRGEEPPFREQAAAQYNDEAIAEDNYYGSAHDGDGAAAHLGAAGEENEEDGAEPAHNDEAVHPFRVAGGSLTYYNTVREKLKAAFARFPKDDRLLKTFPCSEWVKTDTALLGIIYESGMPKFLCVAVEGMSEDDPPEEMGVHAQFVPATPFSDTVGFFVVFQSADTGEYVTVSNS